MSLSYSIQEHEMLLLFSQSNSSAPKISELSSSMLRIAKMESFTAVRDVDGGAIKAMNTIYTRCRPKKERCRLFKGKGNKCMMDKVGNLVAASIGDVCYLSCVQQKNSLGIRTKLSYHFPKQDKLVLDKPEPEPLLFTPE